MTDKDPSFIAAVKSLNVGYLEPLAKFLVHFEYFFLDETSSSHAKPSNKKGDQERRQPQQPQQPSHLQGMNQAKLAQEVKQRR